MTDIHRQYANTLFGYNLLNNGGFTQHLNKIEVLENTSTDRGPNSKDLVDMGLYSPASIGFNLSKAGAVGFWDFSGAAGRAVIAPTDADGNTVTSRDGGNVLKIVFTEDGDMFMDQVLADPRRLEGAPLSISFSGVSFVGEPTVTLVVIVDDVETELTTVSAAAFGAFRRTGAVFTFPDTVNSATIRFKLNGCATDAVGLSGVCAMLGYQSQILNFTSSFVDRAVPSGITYMFVGDACPPGYFQYEDGKMALVSGVKSFQEVAGAEVTTLGQDKHDHLTTTANGLSLPDDTELRTNVPLSGTGTSRVRAVPFQDYPDGVAALPPDSDAPTTVLGSSHTHVLRTDMDCLPPTFPVKFCKKL